MKRILILSAVCLLAFYACDTQKNIPANTDQTAMTAGDTVRIANDELEYEVIIIDGAFNTWLQTNARPRGHYTQQYMEMRNQTWVIEWNNRARNPRYANMFEMPINYESSVDYGYEVNYLLFNYLTYFQLKNRIELGGYVPRI